MAALPLPAQPLPAGIDLSHNNGPVNWPAVAGAGITFCYAKATEGAWLRDPSFAANWTGMREAGLLRGAYHFFHPRRAAGAQARNFIAAVKKLGPGDLPPALDLELTGPHDEWPLVEPLRRVSLVVEWLGRVEQALGRKPVIYGCPAFLSATFPSGTLARYDLWVAHHTPAPHPSLPRGWRAWTFWQHSPDGAVPGVAGKVDLDRYNGPLRELLSLAGAASPPGYAVLSNFAAAHRA